ncbi:MAG: iron-containing alcohol dehydrogenase [Candidatus Hydrogenedentes bacterium]|nr:iron-containing alcohol dehydrogenase [Candidatus Hydrogenedentota bacterium]
MPNWREIISRGDKISKKLEKLSGKTLVVTMEIPWGKLRKISLFEPTRLIYANQMEIQFLNEIVETLDNFDWVIGIGGGVACDMAKFISWKKEIPLILLPTVISVDAPFTASIAIRENDVVKYVGSVVPNEIIIDYNIISQAPPELNRAGVADILSIHTALWDWRLSSEKTGERYDSKIAEEAKKCLDFVEENAEEIRKVSSKGIDVIVDMYCREVDLCTEFGNSRPEEGSEHIVAYCAEYLTKEQFLHGNIVAFGIFCMSRLQENFPDWITGLMDRVGLDFSAGNLTNDKIRKILLSLKEFKDQSDLFYSVIDEKIIDENFVSNILKELNRYER